MLSITDLSIRLAGRLLIDQSSVQITPGSRVGMVGRNGTGKSTLFKVIRGELSAEHGSVTLPPRWRVGSLAQEAPNGPESLISVVLKADLERDALLHEAIGHLWCLGASIRRRYPAGPHPRRPCVAPSRRRHAPRPLRRGRRRPARRARTSPA